MIKEIIIRVKRKECGETDINTILKICVDNIIDPHHAIICCILECIEVLINYLQPFLKVIMPKLLILTSLENKVLADTTNKLLETIKENYGSENFISLLVMCLDKSLLEEVKLNSLKLLPKYIKKDSKYFVHEENVRFCVLAVNSLAMKYSEATEVFNALKLCNIKIPDEIFIIRNKKLSIKEILSNDCDLSYIEIEEMIKNILSEIKLSYVDTKVMGRIVNFIINNSIYGAEEKLQVIGFNALLEIINTFNEKIENILDELITELSRCYLLPRKLWQTIDKIFSKLSHIFGTQKMISIIIPSINVMKPPMLQNVIRALISIIKTATNDELVIIMPMVSQSLKEVIIF